MNYVEVQVVKLFSFFLADPGSSPCTPLVLFFSLKSDRLLPCSMAACKKYFFVSIAACKKEEKVTACCPARWLHKKRKNDRLQLGILGTVYAKNEKRKSTWVQTPTWALRNGGQHPYHLSQSTQLILLLEQWYLSISNANIYKSTLWHRGDATSPPHRLPC